MSGYGGTPVFFIHLNLLVERFAYQLWLFNPLTPELNPSAQRCLTRFFTGDFVP
jgi:hypothetical protein